MLLYNWIDTLIILESNCTGPKVSYKKNQTIYHIFASAILPVTISYSEIADLDSNLLPRVVGYMK